MLAYQSVEGGLVMELKPFEESHTALVAGWANSAQEVALLSGRDEFPFPAELTGSWRKVADDITAYLYFDGAEPVGYGELWLDDEEDGRGIGTAFVQALLQPALVAGYSDVFLRVRPDNERAIKTYLRVGFQPIDEQLAAEWNEPQPINYTWLQYPTKNQD
jgi:RimJ/RimL family protein N-acetyltransferase